MKPVSLDLSKLLGFRLSVVEAKANGKTVAANDSPDIKMGVKQGEKTGDKPDSPARRIVAGSC